jgi:hypothetical protein
MRWADIGDDGNFVRSLADAFDGVVHGVLDVRRWQGRQVGTELAAGAGIGSYPTASAMLHRLRSVLPGFRS